MMSNNHNSSSALMRHHHQETAVVAAAAAQQKSYMGGGVGGGGGGSSSAVGDSGAAVSFNGQAQVFESSSSGFQPYLHGISTEWTPEEQAILDDGLITYASESNIVRYAKIAVLLKNKTVRDVALRCKWIAKRDISKRRKPDLNLAGKGRLKEKSSEPSVLSTHAAMHQGFGAYSQGGIANKPDAPGLSYNAVGGLTGKLLQQNAQALERISANLAMHQVHENIGLLCRTRENILQILNNLSDPPNILNKMPPLPVKIDEELANSILPPSTLQMQQR